MAEMGQAKAAEEWAVARTLFREYADALGVDLCFQGFEEELSGLERMYAPPEGRLFLVHDRGELAGCGALRRIGEGVAELKRMYLRPRFRGRGLGRALAEALLGGAREAGYRVVRLDTLAGMREALVLYRSLGFTEIAPYTANPLPSPIFMELRLR